MAPAGHCCNDLREDPDSNSCVSQNDVDEYQDKLVDDGFDSKDVFVVWRITKSTIFNYKTVVCSYIVMWMQQGRICILGKIEFSADNGNAGKKAQVKLYFMPELKVILYLWKK